MINIAIISEGKTETSKIISTYVSDFLQTRGYHTEIIFIGNKIWKTPSNDVVDKNDFSIKRDGQKIIFQCAYIYSEEEITKGWIQGYLSILSIPYISSSPFTTMLATNKFFCKKILEQAGIPTPKAIKLKTKTDIHLDKIVENIGFPCIVKPNIGTDSLFIIKAKNTVELENGIHAILEQGVEVLIEEFIDGRDMPCGVMALNEVLTATPVTEIVVLDGEFYSYEVKLGRKNEKFTPAPLSEHLTHTCQELSKKIFREIGCDGFVRIDYVLLGEIFYFLEVNVTPGLSPRSNFPLQLEAMNMKIDELFVELINNKLN